MLIPPTAILLAAGRGKRLSPLTDTTPKVMLPIGGKPLLQHQIEHFAAQGIVDFIINLAWLGEQIVDYFGDGSELGVPIRIRYSDEPQGALETGGGIVQAMQQTDNHHFLVANGDVLCDVDIDIDRLRHYPQWSNDDVMHLLLVENPTHHPRGDFGLRGGRLVECSIDAGGVLPDKIDALNSPCATYSGIGYFHREAFDGFTPGRFALTQVIEQAIAARRAGGEIYHGKWIDVGTPARLTEAQQAANVPLASK